MHPETEKSQLSKSLKKRDVTRSLLNPCPVVVPGIPTSLSNLSGNSSTGTVDNDAFAAYSRYQKDDGSVRSKNSRVSFNSQDTFSTYGEANMWGKKRFRIEECSNLDWRWSCTGAFVKSRFFKRLSIFLIVLNCVVCAVATADFVTEDPNMEYYFDLAKTVFVCVMSFELFLQFLHHGFYLFLEGWLVFDFIFVCSAWAVPNLLVMRTFRVVRTLRLASWIKDLKELVLALLLVIPKMFAIFFLLFILFVIFSILFTDLFKHTYDQAITSDDYFGSLSITFFTLFQIMTLDGWSSICKQIMAEYEWAWAPFIAFVIVSSFFFLNLVIAVVCEAVTSVHRETVVKYIQEDISAATSVRDALKVEDRLEELAGSVQLLMQSQVALLDALQGGQQSSAGLAAGGKEGGDKALSPPAHIELQAHRETLQAQLDGSYFGAKSGRASKRGDASKDSSTIGSISLNRGVDEDILRAQYLASIADSDILPSARAPNFPPPRHNKSNRLQFDSSAGPATPSFWRDLGLPEEHVQKVMSAMKEKSIRLVQEQPPQDAPLSPVNEGASTRRANSDQGTTTDKNAPQSSSTTGGQRERTKQDEDSPTFA